MRIAYVAAFEHSWSTETHVATDATLLGHDVVRIRSTKPALIQTEAEDADLLICHRTGLDPSTALVWQLLENQGTKTCSYHLDLYVGLARATQIAADPFWRTQTVFTADGDPATTDTLATFGINHQWLPAAVVSTETQPGTPRPEYDHDVVFVGSKRYHPEWPWRTTLLGFLETRYGPRFHVYDHHPPIRDQNLNDLYATARVVVGDTLALPGHPNFVSDRLFETTGRGGALIFPKVEGVEEAFGFHDREHLMYYTIGDTEQIGGIVDEMLDHSDETRQMAKRGQQHTAAYHTYRARVQQLLLELDLA